MGNILSMFDSTGSKTLWWSNGLECWNWSRKEENENSELKSWTEMGQAFQVPKGKGSHLWGNSASDSRETNTCGEHLSLCLSCGCEMQSGEGHPEEGPVFSPLTPSFQNFICWPGCAAILRPMSWVPGSSFAVLHLNLLLLLPNAICSCMSQNLWTARFQVQEWLQEDSCVTCETAGEDYGCVILVQSTSRNVLKCFKTSKLIFLLVGVLRTIWLILKSLGH